MTTDRMHADSEHQAHLSGRVAAGEEAQDLALSHADLASGPVEPDRVVDDRAGDAAVEISLAAPYGMDRLKQLVGMGAFDDVAPCAGDQGLAHRLRPAVHREDDDP